MEFDWAVSWVWVQTFHFAMGWVGLRQSFGGLDWVDKIGPTDHSGPYCHATLSGFRQHCVRKISYKIL